MQLIFPDLKGKLTLITGATRGIGKQIALELAKQGSHVAFNYRGDKERVQPLIEELEAKGAKKVSALPFDITNYDQMKTALASFTKEEGPITGLVNNAGVSKDQLSLRISPDELSRTLDTNLKGAILLTTLLSRGFLKGTDVSIVNMSSVVGLMGNASQVSYAASKAGLLGFTKSLAKELGPKNIRTNAICPGFIETDMTANLSDSAKNNYLDQIPLKKMGSPQEVAWLTLFLLSKASSYINGEIIKIDGGLYC